ncbi:hypothetical protein ACS0TY_025956 [Phlomoides rotata]
MDWPISGIDHILEVSNLRLREERTPNSQAYTHTLYALIHRFKFYLIRNYNHNLRESCVGHSHADEGEFDDEINELFKIGKKKKKNKKSPAEIALQVETVLAELELAAEADAELNRQQKPALTKLRKLDLLTDALSKKPLQLVFLDHGVLSVLRTWLEPLPDGSLPNINIRAAVFETLNDLPIDLEQYERKEQLQKSGIGRAVMFFYKWDEETKSNRKLAKELVEKWSRTISFKSTRSEDMKNVDDSRPPSARRVANNASGSASRNDDLGLAGMSQGRKSGPSSLRQHASRPEAVRARAKQLAKDQPRSKGWTSSWNSTKPRSGGRICRPRNSARRVVE